MWKRERTERVDLEQVMKTAPTTAPIAQPRTIEVSAPPAPPPPIAAPAPARTPSVLGPLLRFKGELTADEDLVIEGQFEGSVLHTRTLTIGSPGRVRGDIRARRVIVEGRMEGNVYALESVTLRAGAALYGDVFARRISIETGATVTGRIDMDNAPAVPRIDTVGLGAADGPAKELSDEEVGELLSGSAAAAG